jgi:hypothetical protein
MAKTWFLYIGPSPCIGTSYLLVGPQPSCPGNGHLCAIFANPDPSGIYPEIGLSLCTEIAGSLEHGADTANVLLKA